MNPIKPDDLPQHIIDKMTPEQRSEMGLISTDEQNDRSLKARYKREEKAERDIQNQVEAWLIHNGYERRTPDGIRRGKPEKGYFIHLYATKKNPIICDLLILSNSGRFKEIELKTASGVATEEQACLITYGCADLARSGEDAIEIIKAWQDK